MVCKIECEILRLDFEISRIAVFFFGQRVAKNKKICKILHIFSKSKRVYEIFFSPIILYFYTILFYLTFLSILLIIINNSYILFLIFYSVKNINYLLEKKKRNYLKKKLNYIKYLILF